MFSYENFIDYINNSKQAYNLTFAQLAEAADISEKNLNRIANGNHNPNLSTIISILNALNIDLAALANSTVQPKQKYLRTEINKQFSSLSQPGKETVLNVVECMYKYDIETRDN